MTLRGFSYRPARLRLWTHSPAAALILVLGLCAGSAAAETAQDGFGSAVAAYRTGSHGKALDGWRGLADEGNPLAQYNVGLLHYKGHGTTRSYAQALIWFHAAARQGLAASYLRLGRMFERGEGVPHDLEQAYLWYTLAVSAFGPGSCRDNALNRRRSLAKNLTEAQVLKVLAESSEWAPGPLGGVGQPCFSTIAVRPVDGPGVASPAAAQEPKTAVAKKPAAVAKESMTPQNPKTPAVQTSTVASRTRDSKTTAETTVTPPPSAKETASVAPALMSKLPAKMPGGKDHAKTPSLAATGLQEGAEAKPAESLPMVDVAKRKVHTVNSPGKRKIPLVGTTLRETVRPKKQAVALVPAAEVERRETYPPAASPAPPAQEIAMPQPAARSDAASPEKAGSGSAMPQEPKSRGAVASLGKAAKPAMKKPTMKKIARATPPTPRRATASRPKGSVYVQLGALSTRTMADQVWRRLRTGNQDIFGRHQRKIEKIRANGGKVFYRLYAGPFVSDGNADAFCDMLKQRDEACFVPPKFRKRK